MNKVMNKIMNEDYKDFKSKNVDVIPYISDMSKAYKSADIIVTRAGASVISELCIVGKPVILLPSPNLAEDHQTKNAQSKVGSRPNFNFEFFVS